MKNGDSKCPVKQSYGAAEVTVINCGSVTIGTNNSGPPLINVMMLMAYVLSTVSKTVLFVCIRKYVQECLVWGWQDGPEDNSTCH